MPAFPVLSYSYADLLTSVDMAVALREYPADEESPGPFYIRAMVNDDTEVRQVDHASLVRKPHHFWRQ